MIRYFAFVSIVILSAASALAAMAPRHDTAAAAGKNITIIAKNQAFPVYGPIDLEPCAAEDCSE